MARSEKYVFGGIGFTSQKAVELQARAIRDRYARGATISAPSDIAFLRDLFLCNVEAQDKIGSGISRFFWAKSPEHPTDCFWIERLEGGPVDFGVAACLHAIGRLNRASLRAAIDGQVEAYRLERLADATGHFTSDYSGKVYPIAEAEVDHVRPFAEILDAFFQARGIDLEHFMLTLPEERRSEPVWRDPALIESFQEFHRGFPLRLVQRRENQSEIRRDAAKGKR